METSSEPPPYEFGSDDTLEFDISEEEEFHDCTEMETLYLSFDTQDLSSPPSTTSSNRGTSSKSRSTSEEEPSSDEQMPIDADDNDLPIPVESILTLSKSEISQEQSIENEDSKERALYEYMLPVPESENKEGRSSIDGATPDVLVTLTTMDMGISAKREESLPLSKQPSSDIWNIDSIPDSSIFDKARLVEEALDTADIKKCMAHRSEDRHALPSLGHQEQYSDDLRSMTRHRLNGSEDQRHPKLPTYRMETVPSERALLRSHSAPTEMKAMDVMAEDKEISSIMGHDIFHSEARPDTSLSEPFEERPESQTGKRCLTTWVEKKIHFVSFDAESEISVTRSEYIMDLKRGKERREEERRRRRSMVNSQCSCPSGFVLGPCVSPVPAGGIRDFGREDAIALNAALRNEPQLANVPMGEWTSKLIGFATPADYYVHMIHELSAQKIDVLNLIKGKLGDHHPLVVEIIEKLKNYTTEVPSFILSSSVRGHRRTPPLASSRGLSLFAHSDEDYQRSVEAALTHCGVNVAYFNKLRCSFASAMDYYEYLARQIKSSGFVVSVKKLNELLGNRHPFVDVFKNSTPIEVESSRTGSMTDSARSIQSGRPSPRTLPSPRSKSPQTRYPSDIQVVLIGVSRDRLYQVGHVRDEREVEADTRGGSCLFFCFGGLRNLCRRG